MNNLNPMDVIANIYHGDVIEVLLMSEDGYKELYVGSSGNIYMHTNTHYINNLQLVDIGSYVNDIGVSVIVFRVEEK